MAFGIQTLKKFFGKPSATIEAKPKTNLHWTGIWGAGSAIYWKSETIYSDERLFRAQSTDISNAILLQDVPEPKVHKLDVKSGTPFNWLNKGELIAGSSLINRINSSVVANDIDIYFHSKEDAIEWLKINDLPYSKLSDMKSSSCVLSAKHAHLNLIWGVQFDSPEQLLSGFDIRACAIAYDPNEDKLIHVDGAIDDTKNKRIVFQVGVRNLSVHRLMKYLNKGFTVDKYQRVIFAELIKLGRHNSIIELATGEIYARPEPASGGGC